MKKGLRTEYFLRVIFAGIIVIALCTPAYSSEVEEKHGKNTRRIAAKVNGSAIYADQVEALAEKEIASYRKYRPRKMTPEMIHKLRLKALKRAIENELLSQEIKKMTVPDIDRKLDEKLKEVKKKYPSEEHYKRRLSSWKMTEEDMRASLVDSVYFDEYLRKHGISNPEVPEKDIREYYKGNPRAFLREETVKVSHIMIKVEENAGAEEKGQAREKLEKIRSEIMKGKDFAESAKEHSQDGYAQKGGDLGFIQKGYMPREFEDAAFSLEKGQVSGIVETKHGYHIIKLIDRKPRGAAHYDEVKDFLKKYMQRQLEKEKLTAHISELRKGAKIEILMLDFEESENSS